MSWAAEIFTKTHPMSTVGTGDEVGILPTSTWNNPEPEVVLVINSRGRIVGATRDSRTISGTS